MRAFGELTAGVRAALAVVACSAFVVLAAWATLVGPDQVFTGPGPRPATALTPTTSCIPLPVRTAADGSETVVIPDDVDQRDYCEPPDTSVEDARRMVEGTDVPLVLKILVWTVEALIVLGMLAFVGWVLLALRDAWQRRAGREREPADLDFETLSEPARLAAAMTEDARGQDELLRDGEARNAIVAAWARFEVQGARAGSPRQAWETSAEYTLRILDLVEADAGAVHRLASLYREARFSEHPITEEHREAALDALAEIRRTLGVRA
ncbi:DUF4129 domain-containing protein [Nocardioides sp. J2M5]|uniref:DUF4129 domain-containing protein n=1 Tax=Nocardioides palaemonis TaxID=2829810 RepID=UPI001BA4D2B1|nr:DUF4129 domain-containing protein [Nocardioides palaemonis]MBS2938984.1 DUF4129 domain-containing protein [Nocardioides palaemonis]